RHAHIATLGPDLNDETTRTWLTRGAPRRGDVPASPRVEARPGFVGTLRARGGMGGHIGAPHVMASNQELERAEVAVGEVLEPATAGGDGGLGAVEAGDRAKQVLVVLAQLQLDGAGERRIAGQLQRRAVAVAAGIDQRAKAQALQPLGDG